MKLGEKYKNALELVDNKFLTGDRQVPRLFLALSGTLTQEKVTLANKVMIDWQVRVQKNHYDDTECPFLQPDTQNTYRRTFYGHMSSHYGWNIGDSILTGFKGCFADVLEALYEKRFEKWVRTHLIVSFCIFCVCTLFCFLNNQCFVAQ